MSTYIYMCVCVRVCVLCVYYRLCESLHVRYRVSKMKVSRIFRLTKVQQQSPELFYGTSTTLAQFSTKNMLDS